jgi:pyridinium-3,5-biscarboxylic acid mononucleotide sulfurtransferase
MERHWEDGDDRKLAELLRILREMKSIVVACSGGADSVFLAAAAHHALGARALIVTAVSASLPRRELADVQRLARAYGWTHRVVGTRELENEAYAVNASDRCYHCKAELFRQLRALADAEGYEWVADGSNTDDLRDYRPGARAQREWQVRCPLQEAGFAKAELRAAARRIGLATADKPASACLASRLPYGTRITAAALKAVEDAEAALRDMGFGQVRVRAHGPIARIELDPRELERVADEPLRARMVRTVKACGFRYVALDLDGYRMGSLNPE